jgi:predicted DsbA family dithiol-disulfide isomerase
VRTDRLAAEYDIKIEVVHFPLHPETPVEGTPLAEVFGGGPEGAARMKAAGDRFKTAAAEEGLALGERSMTYSSRLAQELGLWAESRGKGSEFHRLVFEAYFVHGKNIAEKEILVGLARNAGLDPEEAHAVLTERSFQRALDEQWSRSLAAGVDLVPTFEAGGKRLLGAEPYEVLENLVVAAGARKRSAGDHDAP